MLLSWALLASALVACAAPPREVLRRPARTIYLSPSSAARLEVEFEALATQRTPAVLMVSEEELNSYLQAHLAQSDVLQALRVWFIRDGLYVVAELDLLGSHQFDIALYTFAEQGDLRVSVQQAALDGRPLADLALKALNEAAQVALADAHLPLIVERVTLGEGRLILWASGEPALP